MDNFLDSSGNLLLKSNSEWDVLPFTDRRLFCHFHARYLLPTVELVDFLKGLIGDQDTIEIGAGCGDLGRHLGIRMTDSFIQELPEVKQFYELTGQPTIRYGADVERLEAQEAIEKYKPHTVIGSWVTHWIDPDEPPPPGGGSVFGIREDELLKKVKRYILIGAEEIHKHKKIMALPHKTLEAPFVRSRREDNKIWIWER